MGVSLLLSAELARFEPDNARGAFGRHRGLLIRTYDVANDELSVLYPRRGLKRREYYDKIKYQDIKKRGLFVGGYYAD
jgi:hypothetical protein